MFGSSGRAVRDEAEAQEFIRTFLQFEREHREDLAKNKEHDYDLYLPWLMEVVINAPETEDGQPPVELDRTYMDAAWGLVTQGYVRPGPRSVTGDGGSDGYGKGFTLTAKGREWVNSK